MSFFNTIQSNPQTLIQFEAEAQSQESLVAEVYRTVKKPMAWFEVLGFLQDMNPVSLKRSITNLKTKGVLFKTNEMICGPFGKNVHRYALTNY